MMSSVVATPEAKEVRAKIPDVALSGSRRDAAALSRYHYYDEETGMPTFIKDANALSRLTPEQFRVTQQNATERPGKRRASAQRGAWHLRRHRIGRAAVRIVGQVRLGVRLAELHQAH
jgi:hypothetical protein